MRRGKLLEGILVEGVAAGGKGVARYQGKVMFIEGAVPGDVVDVKIKKDRKDYTEARTFKIVTPSKERKEPKCIHFEDCGGCKWQYLDYSKQLELKDGIVKNAFQRIAKIEPQEYLPILGAETEYYYRNKMEFTFSSQRWKTIAEVATGKDLEVEPGLGLHPPRSFAKVVNLEECHLQADPSNEIRKGIRDYALAQGYSFYDILKHVGFLRTLLMRSTKSGQLLIVLVMAEDDAVKREDMLQFIASTYPQVTSLNYIINKKLNDSLFDQEVVPYKGEPYIYETLGDLQFKISPKSFFQTNSLQAERLYDVAKEFAELKGNEKLIDLYCGTGSIGLYMADQCESVIGVETVADAIVDAKSNAELNSIGNCEFLLGDVKDVLDEKFIARVGTPDIIITDPPRAGMVPAVVEALLELRPEKIVYVSCNPATQARDVRLLSGHYDLIKSRAVDMFPQTYHIENVVLLKKKA